MPAPITFADALHQIGGLRLSVHREQIGLDAAAGRVLAEDVCLARAQPPFDRATMDGFAVRLDGDRATFDIVGEVMAGSTATHQLKPGQAVRIMTGAPAPAGTTVIPIEATDHVGKAKAGAGLTHRTTIMQVIVTVTDPALLKPGRNIAWTGEDGAKDAVVVRAGTRLSPATVAVAAMAGARDLAVAAQPRLAVVTTGDEVGLTNDAGICDSNGPFLSGFAAALGLPCTRSHAKDDPILLRAALVNAFSLADVVITTGGVSAGDRDLIPVLLPSLGMDLVFHQVDMQPGKPVLLARRHDGKFLVGLPGNPVSVLATAHLILLPLLNRLLGRLDAAQAWERQPLSRAWQHRGKRRLFLPAKRSTAGVEPITWNGSGDLIAAAAGDGLIDIDPGADLAPGSSIPFLPYVGTMPGQVGVLPDRKPTR